MSLRHALLATLTAQPMTGYELVKYFDGSVAYVWSAPHSQIYPELRRMERDGLVTVEVVPRGERAEKRVYSINEAGLAELQRWEQAPIPYQSDRDPYRLKVAHFEQSTYEAARSQLEAHLHHFTRALREWEQILADIDARRVSLLRRRLGQRPEEEHEAIIAFRKLAFRGEVLKARAEIAWAEEGLAVLDELQAKGVPLRGEEFAKPAGH
ncbi:MULTISPECIES: PadR family transcriptional regulator [Actinomadura]|jgi:DNA-binding PadR family transcriptional regulator|uniref:PadR family transcriptional regulator n=1 Tax=Actinomadura geliboluensis TaxID=882440 RepID=A0A5S4HC98_9ACTN|nr:PadR family transcriptional regulator [Actinomadura geliboluensis]TMR42364.1 PadR family transcriptional regulator [Actinomadura geliboluensis]